MEAGMVALMGERSQAGITGYDVLNVPDDIVYEFGDKGVGPERADLRFQEIHLINDILGMNDTYCRISCSVQTVQGSAVDQILQLRLDICHLVEKQLLILMGDATLQFISYRIVKRADFCECHLLLRHVIYSLSC